MNRDTIKLDYLASQTHFNTIWESADKSPWSSCRPNLLEIGKIKLFTLLLGTANTILDLGCGGGEFMEHFREQLKNKKVLGVDIAENAITKASRSSIYSELKVGDIVSSECGVVDLIVLNEVLYYIKDYVDALTKILRKHSKAGTTVFLSLAIGPSFYSESNEIKDIRKVLANNGFYRVQEKRVSHTWHKIPLRLCFWKKLPQTHKLMMVYKNML